MKLLSCHITNFGKLSDFDYKFIEELNIIKEENGFGKTTFANFIKAMFFGLDSKRNTKTLIDRKKYDPWQGGTYGGSIEFEIHGKKYKIERIFAKKEAEDTFKLYDLDTNLESEDYTQNIGEEIFKLDKEAFERSVFVSGQNMETSMNDSINAKLANVLENENDVNSSEKALKILDEAIKVYKKTSGRGEINEQIAEKTKLEQKLENSKIDEKNLNDRKNKYLEINKEIELKKDEYEKLNENISFAIKQEAQKAKIEQYNLLKENAENCLKTLEQYKENIKNDNELQQKIEVNKDKIEEIKTKTKKIEENINKK